WREVYHTQFGKSVSISDVRTQLGTAFRLSGVSKSKHGAVKPTRSLESSKYVLRDYQKYARGLRAGFIKWEIEGAPGRLQLGDDMQNWPDMNAVRQAMRLAAD